MVQVSKLVRAWRSTGVGNSLKFNNIQKHVDGSGLGAKIVLNSCRVVSYLVSLFLCKLHNQLIFQ